MAGPVEPRLLKRAEATRNYLVASVVVGILTSVLVIAQAWLLARGVAIVFTYRALPDDWGAMLALLFAVFAARGLLAWVNSVLAHRSAAAVKSRLRRDVLAAHLTRPVASSATLTKAATTGLDALDVGMSTGGFTHCLLARGARQVLGIEVGHGQLDPALAADPRVHCLEHTHIRDVHLADLRLPDGTAPAQGFALIVVDLSFIAASHLLDKLATLAAPVGRLTCLIKPQFELGPQARNRQGIVRADADLDGLRRDVIQRAEDAGWQVDDWQRCALVGGDGNQEYFLIATRRP